MKHKTKTKPEDARIHPKTVKLSSEELKFYSKRARGDYGNNWSLMLREALRMLYVQR